MKKNILLTAALFFAGIIASLSQDSTWIKNYTSQYGEYMYDLIETYDHGYLITGTIKNEYGNPDFALLIKTDVNGEILWEKRIGFVTPQNYWVNTGGELTRQTLDGGYIVTGGTFEYDLTSDIFVIKLNSCGEKEWSKIYLRENGQTPVDIQVLPDSGYFLNVNGWSWTSSENSMIIKLSPQGETEWIKLYADWDTLVYNYDSDVQLIPDNSGNFIMVGDYYEVEEPGSQYLWERPMLIEIDTAGNEIWHTVYTGNFYVAEPRYGDVDSKDNIYLAERCFHSDQNWPGVPAALQKFDSTGNEVWTRLLLDTLTDIGAANTVSVMDDSMLFVVAGYSIHYSPYKDTGFIYIAKYDTSGYELKKILISKAHTNDPYPIAHSSLITYDKKLLVGFTVHNTPWCIQLRKLNKDLEYDSIYTRQFTYDSLCPYQIVSDTIDLDTTYVDLKELVLNLTPMSLYPNPAASTLRVEINIVKRKWRLLAAVNLSGQQVFSETIPPGKANTTIDVSDWPAGLYIFKLYENGGVVQAEKIMVK